MILNTNLKVYLSKLTTISRMNIENHQLLYALLISASLFVGGA